MDERHIFKFSNGEICLQSAAAETDPVRPGCKLERGKLRVYIDSEPIKLVTDDSGIRFTLPTLRATASLTMPALKAGASWQFGWILACASLVDQQTYGEFGEAVWELPHAFVNASDGSRMPWHGSTTQSAAVRGPTSADAPAVTVSLTLKLEEFARWRIALPGESEPADATPRLLTNLRRQYEYLLWLAAANDDISEVHVLKTFKWDADVRLRMDYSKPLAQRASFEDGRSSVGSPVLLDNIEIPEHTLQLPTYDQVKKLVWYPSGGAAPTVLVPPQYELY